MENLCLPITNMAGAETEFFGGSQAIFIETEGISVGNFENPVHLSGEVITVPISSLNAIVQARNTYTHIEVLAAAIESSGTVIHTPFVAQFDRDGAKAYLSFVYGIYGNKVPHHRTVDELVHYTDNVGEESYLIVIAGHRRLRALQLLNVSEIDVKVKKDIDPLDALVLQAQENTYKSLTDDERAEQHGRLWAVSKAKEPSLTQEKFARRVGITVASLRKDLRFYNLPEEVKKFATTTGETLTTGEIKTFLPFNVVCQLGRLTEAGAPEHDILFLGRRLFEQNVTSEKVAREKVSRYLKNFNSQTTELIDIFGQNAVRLSRLRKHREVAMRFTFPVDEAIAYFSRVDIAHQNGFADPQEDGLSFAGAATRLVHLADVLEPLATRMEETLGPEEAARIAKIFRDSKNIALNVDSQIQERK